MWLESVCMEMLCLSISVNMKCYVFYSNSPSLHELSLPDSCIQHCMNAIIYQTKSRYHKRQPNGGREKTMRILLKPSDRKPAVCKSPSVLVFMWHLTDSCLFGTSPCPKIAMPKKGLLYRTLTTPYSLHLVCFLCIQNLWKTCKLTELEKLESLFSKFTKDCKVTWCCAITWVGTIYFSNPEEERTGNSSHSWQEEIITLWPTAWKNAHL